MLGGSDNKDNYSKRVQFFSRYINFIEKPPMINKRAFFPTVFAKLDNSLYVLGGNDSHTDMVACEKFSLAESVWRPISPLNVGRNGCGAVIFEHHRLIFAFGGNNKQHGSLNKIEKYEVDFDKWTTTDVNLKMPIHDMSIINLGKERVLIFGG